MFVYYRDCLKHPSLHKEGYTLSSTVSSDDKLRVLSSAPPETFNLLSRGRIKQSCFRSVHSTTGRAASPADMYQYKGDGRKAGDRRHCD